MHCREEKIPEDSEFPKVWEWLSDPKTTKEEKTINGTEWIFYTGHVSLVYSWQHERYLTLAKPKGLRQMASVTYYKSGKSPIWYKW